jgi:hypothetical protein
MEHEMMQGKVAIVGGGASGCAAACFLNIKNEVVIFEKNEPLNTILYTGGGRCNLAHEEFDFKNLARNYPRGEKFLYSIFSKFSTIDTLKFFDSIGVKTYTQPDKRIFPISDNAKTVKDALLNEVKRKKTKIIKEKITAIKKEEKYFLLNNKYKFEKVIISVGGHSGYKIAEELGHNIIVPMPSLVGLITKEKFCLEGVSLKNIEVTVHNIEKKITGDLLFTKNGISGPVAYIISSLFARLNYNQDNPIKVSLNFQVNNFVDILNKNGKKNLKTVLAEYMPKSVAEYISTQTKTSSKRACEILKKERLEVEKYLTNFPITVVGHEKTGEVVTSGGISLDEINSKTMQSKLVDGLYFCGEVINVDGFCGGFNLQNAWSTAYVAANDINSCYNFS